MRLKLAVATLALLSLPVGSAMADSFWRNVISSGATTGSTYLTFKDHKLIVAAQDDAGSFVASDGGIRGPYLEAAMQKVRQDSSFLATLEKQGVDVGRGSVDDVSRMLQAEGPVWGELIRAANIKPE